MPDRIIRSLLLGAALLGAPLVAAAPAPASRPNSLTHGGTRNGTRNARWARALRRPGLPNLHRVSPSLYRGAQPTPAGFSQLKKLGVRTVINLRSFHSDRREIRATGLGYLHLHMKAWHPEQRDLVRFLRLVSDRSKGPFFLHCQQGADRTGLLSAVYRVVIQGWSKQAALEEMKHGGYGFHGIWRNLERYLLGLDVAQLRAALRKAAAARSAP